MRRPLTQLLHRDVQQGDAGQPRVVTLHGHNQHGGDVREYGLAANPSGRVVALESSKGVFVGKNIVGYTWFVGPDDRPAPLFFGDALAEIERFLWDEVDRQDRPDAELPFLLGVGQGAIVALATAAAVPDLLSGVIAIDGTFPIVPGWQPPLAPLDGLPVLLVSSTPTLSHGSERPGVLTGTTLSRTFEGWGATVTDADVAAGELPADAMSTWLTAQPTRRIVPAPESTTIV